MVSKTVDKIKAVVRLSATGEIKKDKNPVESPINITSVSENGAVRFINGVQCQIQDKNGDWHDVEFLKIEVLEKLLNDDKYVNAHEAIRAAINAKAVEVK